MRVIKGNQGKIKGKTRRAMRGQHRTKRAIKGNQGTPKGNRGVKKNIFIVNSRFFIHDSLSTKPTAATPVTTSTIQVKYKIKEVAIGICYSNSMGLNRFSYEIEQLCGENLLNSRGTCVCCHFVNLLPLRHTL